MLPHVGLATSTITEYASFAANNKFYKQIINPKDWVKSTTFGGYIFVGKYTTTGDGYRQVRNSKIYAMDNNEFLRLVLSKSTKWPRTPVAGFNFVRHG
jgi:hypothetical protein